MNIDYKRISRRAFIRQSCLLAATSAALTGGASVADAATRIPVTAKRKCATCQYWGGARSISQDGKYVEAVGKGECENPKSPAYQRQTKPDQGAPVWVKWQKLG
ncbi:hypothetical protein [Sneathiella aquimaris]|uniref:hypothetical protein n=1 Tax=Sneathiella aquimaris TaxID=2599305 RepID=UPI00146A16DD|nr:hypothetical protein [Sneathiella aquimaris]